MRAARLTMKNSMANRVSIESSIWARDCMSELVLKWFLIASSASF